jgi:2-polyprenyl-6-methoxyphenol hydroxylase-like FAD-dependent oxidoreductase
MVVKFADGTEARGGLLVGADGNNSTVRSCMKMENTKLTSLPVNLLGVVRHLTPEQAVPLRELNPLLFFALHPDTKMFCFFGIQVRLSVSY